MTIRLVPPTLLQNGDTIITPDNHQWSVKFIDGPDKCGSVDVSLIDNQGNQRMEILTEQVKLVM